jgi:DNA-directed RNA polymerase subunit RPC12/RpoP
MGTKHVRTTSDFSAAKANARIVCTTCMRSRIVEASVLQAWFLMPVSLDEAGKRMRCSRCSGRGAVLSPVPV